VQILFAIMLTQTKAAPPGSRSRRRPHRSGGGHRPPARRASRGRLHDLGGGPDRGDTDTNAVATALFSQFVLPFEVVGVLLLAAVIGGIFLAKRDRTTPTDRVE